MTEPSPVQLFVWSFIIAFFGMKHPPFVCQKHIDCPSLAPDPKHAPAEYNVRAPKNKVASSFPSGAYVRYLSDLGYPTSAAVACMMRGHLPWMLSQDDRRKAKRSNAEKQKPGDTGWEHQAIHDPDHPYVLASPSRRTTVGGGFTREQVMRVVAGMRLESDMAYAVVEVVYAGQQPKKVADRRGLVRSTVANAATRARKRLAVQV